MAVARWTNGKPDCFGCSEPFSVRDIKPEDGLKPFIGLAWPKAPRDVLSRYQVVVAIDAPLGFPIAFQRLVAGCLPEDRPAEKEIHNAFAYRKCERVVYERFDKKKPLSAPFDKLGNNATVALVYSRAWASRHGLAMLPFQEAALDASVIIEVYPALAKDDKTGACLKPFVDCVLPRGVEPHTDAYDACLCALMALAFRSQNEQVLPKLEEPSGEGRWESEGWIYHPRPFAH